MGLQWLEKNKRVSEFLCLVPSEKETLKDLPYASVLRAPFPWPPEIDLCLLVGDYCPVFKYLTRNPQALLSKIISEKTLGCLIFVKGEKLQCLAKHNLQGIFYI